MFPEEGKPNADSVKVDFDDYADNYESILQEQLKGFSADREYFSESKIRVIQRLANTDVSTVLDYGCGIGLNLSCLMGAFPQARVIATDISSKSLSAVNEKYADVECVDFQDISKLDSTLDLIFVAGVFHHVPPCEREGVVDSLVDLLSPGGQLFVFEHNPYNPVTRHMVNTCPFDEDAVLLKCQEMCQLLNGNEGMRVNCHKYFLFFPYVLRLMQPVERFMGWLPLGGQYMVLATRSGEKV